MRCFDDVAIRRSWGVRATLAWRWPRAGRTPGWRNRCRFNFWAKSVSLHFFGGEIGVASFFRGRNRCRLGEIGVASFFRAERENLPRTTDVGNARSFPVSRSGARSGAGPPAVGPRLDRPRPDRVGRGFAVSPGGSDRRHPGRARPVRSPRPGPAAMRITRSAGPGPAAVKRATPARPGPAALARAHRPGRIV
jgi:hypothetical protein